MGRYPHRLEKARALLSASASDGLVQNPGKILNDAGIKNPYQALRKLEERKEIEIIPNLNGRRINLARVFPIISRHSASVMPDVIEQPASLLPDAPVPPRQSSPYVSDNSWKTAPDRLSQVFRLLLIKAQEDGTYPVVKDPALLLAAHGIKPSSEYFKKLEDDGFIETIRDERKAVVEVKVLKKDFLLYEQKMRKKKFLIRQKERSISVSMPCESTENAVIEEPKAKKRNNCVRIMVDLENVLSHLFKDGKTIDMKRFRNLCENNFGVGAEVRSFVSVGWYDNMPFELRQQFIDTLNTMPVTFVPNGKDSVDTAILEETKSAIRFNRADQFFIATYDKGEKYQALVKEARSSSRPVKLIVFGAGLSPELVVMFGKKNIINIAESDRREFELHQRIKKILEKKSFSIGNADTSLIRGVLMVLDRSMGYQEPLSFMRITHAVWDRAIQDFRLVDCVYAHCEYIIGGLIRHSDVFIEKRSQERRVYFLNRKSLLLKLALQ